ncbi:MAG: EAL domain-containing protein, partial [Desulfobacterales bacterium]
SLVNTYDQSFAILKEIEEMGLRVTMDDFGTGYSSLSYLRNIPLSGLKIDRSFISDIDQDENADKLIASIVSIAHGLGLEVVAEGVEEAYQVDHLIALDCEYLQGYYFSRPVPQREVADLLQKQPMRLRSTHRS